MREKYLYFSEEALFCLLWLKMFLAEMFFWKINICFLDGQSQTFAEQIKYPPMPEIGRLLKIWITFKVTRFVTQKIFSFHFASEKERLSIDLCEMNRDEFLRQEKQYGHTVSRKSLKFSDIDKNVGEMKAWKHNFLPFHFVKLCYVLNKR